MKPTALIFLILLFFGCNQADAPLQPSASTLPNILLIIADDMGKDATSGFSEGSIKPNTPNLDQIASEGIRFSNFWSNPTCSPTRAAILTGKYGYRTGVKWANDALPASETTLHRYISEGTGSAYSTALIGKWHLSEEGTAANPEDFGIGYYAGLSRGEVQDYYQWQLTEDGAGSLQTEYVSKVFTDLAIDWVARQSAPWLLWLAYTAPHTPFHIPPETMHTQGDLPEYSTGTDPTPYYMAAIEAMDFQIGRLLNSLPEEVAENTVIIFLADNGTPAQVVQAPYSETKAKGSLYQGGINVPLFISGKGIDRKAGEDQSLICSADLFATIANLAGMEVAVHHDSQSFSPVLSGHSGSRSFQYAEMDNGAENTWAISNGQYKLIVKANGEEELFHLAADPYESHNLLTGTLTTAETEAKNLLENALSEIRQ